MHISWRGVAVLLALAGLPARASGQVRERVWGVGVDVGLTRFWGGSGGSTADSPPGVRPYRPTSATFRIDRAIGRTRIGLAISYAASGLGVEDEDLIVVSKGGLTWVQVAPELAYRLAKLGPAAELRVFGGPVADFWIPDEEGSRTRLGARGGAELLVPLGSWLACTLRAHGGVTGSLFRDADLPSGFESRMMPNAGLSVGLRFGL